MYTKHTTPMEKEIKLLREYLGVHPKSELKEVLEARIKELEEKLISNSAEFVSEIIVRDPDSNGRVEMSVFKHNDSGGMFAVDSSYLEQCFDDDTDPVIQDPFNDGQTVTLYNL
jgi:hypothetical protein